MNRLAIAVLAAFSLGLVACGLGETAASAAAGGASQVEQAKEAKAAQERIEQQLNDAAQQAAQQREAADRATE